MTDLVERLRDLSTAVTHERRKTMDEAADEIDRLRAENEWMRAELKKVADLIANDASKRS